MTKQNDAAPPAGKLAPNRVEAALDNGRPERGAAIAVRNHVLEEAVTAIQKIRRGHAFPAEVRVAIIRLQKAATEALGTFLEVKDDLIHQYGEDGEIRPDMESWPEAKAEYEALLNMEAEIDADPLPLAAFGDKDVGEEFDALYRIGLISEPGGGVADEA